ATLTPKHDARFCGEHRRPRRSSAISHRSPQLPFLKLRRAATSEPLLSVADQIAGLTYIIVAHFTPVPACPAGAPQYYFLSRMSSSEGQIDTGTRLTVLS